MTAPGAFAGTVCCALAGITNPRVSARTAIIRIARPGATDALVAPPPAERCLRRVDHGLHACCLRAGAAAAALAAAVGGGAGRDRAAAAAAAVPRAPGVRAGTLAVPRARRQRGQLSRWRFQQRRLLAGADRKSPRLNSSH